MKKKLNKKVKVKKNSKAKPNLFWKNIWVKLGAVFGLVCLILVFMVFGILSPVKEITDFKLEPGTPVISVARQMKEKNLVVSEKLFRISVLLRGGRVQTGTYEIKSGASVWRISRMMARGDIASATVMIPEGLTVQQIKQLLLDTPTLSGSVECAAGQKKDPVCNLKDGDLFPDTFRVAKGTARLDVLRLSVKKMESIRIGWDNSGKYLPAPLKNWNQVVTLASIIQKETPRVSEMPIVSSVYLNRLKKKMKLQADPTVVYAVTKGLGDMQGKALYTSHLQTAHPYNTYMNHGLPPAPIANVGRDAIAAVLNPADTNYLFFCADGQGGHKFARTYAEHQKNHIEWRKIKKQINSEN